jgi:hypothetical protein
VERGWYIGKNRSATDIVRAAVGECGGCDERVAKTGGVGNRTGTAIVEIDSTALIIDIISFIRIAVHNLTLRDIHRGSNVSTIKSAARHRGIALAEVGFRDGDGAHTVNKNSTAITAPDTYRKGAALHRERRGSAR